MKQVSFDGLCLIVDLDKKGGSVREVNEVSIELPWHFLLVQQGLRKNVLLYGIRQIPGVLTKGNMDDRRYLGIYFTKLNSRLVKKERSILLLMDRAGCHPSSLESKFSIIKITFLPANTTSKVQPLDLAIIQNFKVHYKCLLLLYVMAIIDECQTASEVVKSINILIAIRWVPQAWSMVTVQTISKCFRRAGVLDSEMDIVSCNIEEDDPFLAVDEEAYLVSLMNDVAPISCSPVEYVNGEDDIPVWNDLDSLIWEEDFIKQLSQEDDGEENDEDEEDDSMQVLVLKVKTYKEAILALEDVQTFLESRGHLHDLAKIGIAVESLASLHLASMTQKTAQFLLL